MKTIIAITGPSGSGKSTLCNYIKKEGGIVLDCDTIAKDLYSRKSSDLFKGIVHYFDNGVLNDKGYIDHSKLADIIFANPRNRKKLTNLVYPDLRRQLEAQISEIDSDLIYLDMAVYFDMGDRAPDVKYVVTVDANFNTRVARLIAKGLDESRANSQAKSLKFGGEEKQYSSLYIYNNGLVQEMFDKFNNCLIK